MSSEIRSAREQDIAYILELWRQATSVSTISDTPSGLRGLLAFNPESLLIVDADGAVLGTLIATWDGWRGSFYRLAVHPDHRRMGMGRALLDAGEQLLIRHGARRFSAIVTSDDPGAAAFWTAAGYQPQPNRARYVKEPAVAS